MQEEKPDFQQNVFCLLFSALHLHLQWLYTETDVSFSCGFFRLFLNFPFK